MVILVFATKDTTVEPKGMPAVGLVKGMPTTTPAVDATAVITALPDVMVPVVV